MKIKARSVDDQRFIQFLREKLHIKKQQAFRIFIYLNKEIHSVKKELSVYFKIPNPSTSKIMVSQNFMDDP